MVICLLFFSTYFATTIKLFVLGVFLIWLIVNLAKKGKVINITQKLSKN